MSENRNGKTKSVPAVVAGVDGSAGAKEALRWAIAEARLRHWPLRAVYAWMSGLYTPLGVDLGDLHRSAEELLERALAEVKDEADGIGIDRLVVQGAAAGVLVNEATPDDLLVVGSRGHGGFAGLMLGSVSQQCVHHASCPIVVVHSPKLSATSSESGKAAEARDPAIA